MHALVASAPDKGRKISIDGLISLSNHLVRTLFYYGASHSFISDSVVQPRHLTTSLVLDPFVVSNPIGGSARLSMICWGFRISIIGVEFKRDTYVLGSWAMG